MKVASCPYCGLPGHEAVIPTADGEPGVERGIRYDCGTTSHVQSRLCAMIEPMRAVVEAAGEMVASIKSIRGFSAGHTCPEVPDEAWDKFIDALEAAT